MNVNPASGTIDYLNVPKMPKGAPTGGTEDLAERISALRLEMFAAAEKLDFEKAARLRDELRRVEKTATDQDPPQPLFEPYAPTKGRSSAARSKSSFGRTKEPAKAAKGRGR